MGTGVSKNKGGGARGKGSLGRLDDIALSTPRTVKILWSVTCFFFFTLLSLHLPRLFSLPAPSPPVSLSRTRICYVCRLLMRNSLFVV